MGGGGGGGGEGRGEGGGGVGGCRGYTLASDTRHRYQLPTATGT